MEKKKTKTFYEWVLEVVDENDDIIDMEHAPDLGHYGHRQLKLVLSKATFEHECGDPFDPGVTLCRYELALTKRRYEVLPTFNANGEANEDLLDLLDIGYAYVGCDDEGELPVEFTVEGPGKVPVRFKAALAKRIRHIFRWQNSLRRAGACFR